MKFRQFVLIIIGLCLFACNKNDEDSKSYDFADPATGNFINVFITNPESLELEFVTNIRYHVPCIRMSFLYDMYRSVAYCSPDGYQLEMYKKYAKFYGDTTYHERHILGEPNACAAPLSKINVTSDKDYDEAHPAGTSLNDLFLISYPRLYQYIKSGYKPQQGMNSYELDSVSELTAFKEEPLFECETHLLFKKQPDAPGKYTFTVTLDFGEDPLTGKKVTVPPASIEIEF
ncbi:MAG: hypothetical protein J6T60_13205 [Bacteroidales bacterium]|nr:hypothetical protein [Bacteroidales bacterium]